MIAERPFSSGFLMGLVAAFAILILLWLLVLLFRTRKLRFILIPSEEGDLRIDAKAVQGAVRSVAEKFPAFEVRRVSLLGKQKAVELEIAMDFIGGGVSVSEVSGQFRAAITRMMTETFGMEKPARIELEIMRSGADIPASEENVESVLSREEEPSSPEPGQPC